MPVVFTIYDVALRIYAVHCSTKEKLMSPVIDRRHFIKRVGIGSAAAAIAASYPLFIERQMIHINTYRVPVPHLPPSFENFTIVHLTDLHYGPLVSVNHCKKVLSLIEGLPKDCVICTGDFVHERDAEKEIDVIWPLLGELSAPAGVFSVLGNHDHWSDTDRSIYWMRRNGQCLHHKVITLQRGKEALHLAGAGDLWEDHISIDRLVESIPGNECVIVAAHNPDSADTMLYRQPDLFITGHTHGGQVQFPLVGPPVLPVKNKRYSSGLLESDAGTPLFISKGIGWALYPVRFNCIPEIAVLKLTRRKTDCKPA